MENFIHEYYTTDKPFNRGRILSSRRSGTDVDGPFRPAGWEAFRKPYRIRGKRRGDCLCEAPFPVVVPRKFRSFLSLPYLFVRNGVKKHQYPGRLDALPVQELRDDGTDHLCQGYLPTVPNLRLFPLAFHIFTSVPWFRQRRFTMVWPLSVLSAKV